jgi:hypothetical protein
MPRRGSLRAVALAAAVGVGMAGARAADATKSAASKTVTSSPAGKENYDVSEDDYLLPVRKDQPPPDLRYFKLPPR